MENIRLECPHCRQRLEIEASYAGTKCKCPVCNGEFVVPLPTAVPSRIAPPPVAGQGYGVPSYGYSSGGDDETDRRKLSNAFKGYIGFTVAAIIVSFLLFFGTAVLFVLAYPYSEEGGAVGDTGAAFLAIIFIGFLAICALGLLALIFKCILLYRLWSLVPPEEAATTPGKAVGFQFIPLFNLYWNFIAYGELGKYLRLVTGSAAPHILASIYSWLPVAGLALSFVHAFGVIVSFFTPGVGSVIMIGASAVGNIVSILSPVADIAMMVSLTKAARRWRNWA